jgi:hypothetical protein
MNRLSLIPIAALILLVGAGATAGLSAGGASLAAPPVQVQALEKLTPDAPAVPEPVVSVSPDDDSPPHPGEKPDIQYPNLGSALDQMVAAVEDAGASPQGTEGADTVSQPEPMVVTIYLSGHIEDVVAFLEDNGGDPRNVGEDYIEAYVPVILLGELSGQPGVLRVREIIPPMAN